MKLKSINQLISYLILIGTAMEEFLNFCCSNFISSDANTAGDNGADIGI